MGPYRPTRLTTVEACPAFPAPCDTPCTVRVCVCVCVCVVYVFAPQRVVTLVSPACARTNRLLCARQKGSTDMLWRTDQEQSVSGQTHSTAQRLAQERRPGKRSNKLASLTAGTKSDFMHGSLEGRGDPITWHQGCLNVNKKIVKSGSKVLHTARLVMHCLSCLRLLELL